MELLLPAIGLSVALICLLGLALLRRRSSSGKSSGGAPDPLAEAEVYLAYGKKQEALAILQRAAAADPSRKDIAAKLSSLRQAT
jgi:hypothetical protein